MPSVTAIGLGRVGGALARVLLDAGVPLTVWNRNPARTYDLESRAAIGLNAAAACAASEVIVMCLSQYATALEVLDGVAGSTSLDGKTLLQFTSGTPSDARAMQAWANMHGMNYLDIALIDQPSTLGQDDTVIIAAGDEPAWHRAQPVLGSLGGRVRYAGDNPGAAAALACGVLQYYYGLALSMLHGAALCDSENVPLNEFFFLAKGLGERITTTADEAREMIRRERYDGDGATLSSHVPLLRHIQRLSHDNEVHPRMADIVIAAYKKAVASGHGDDDLAALFEILRRED